jgi:hypothetical protein
MQNKFLRIVNLDSYVIDELFEIWNSYSCDYEGMMSCNLVAGFNVSEEIVDSIFKVKFLYSSTLEILNRG